MGVEPFLVSAALRLTIAQRLLRRLCPQCREPRVLSEQDAIILIAPGIGRTAYFCAGRLCVLR
ncbi:MAG: hypothetical protein RQ715_07295 [Methylococcales bacterium]|nr:hypothetical protein [Methylococcales bacterium]